MQHTDLCPREMCSKFGAQNIQCLDRNKYNRSTKPEVNHLFCPSHFLGSKDVQSFSFKISRIKCLPGREDAEASSSGRVAQECLDQSVWGVGVMKKRR
jgi:hypothetical protein